MTLAAITDLSRNYEGDDIVLKERPFRPEDILKPLLAILTPTTGAPLDWKGEEVITAALDRVTEVVDEKTLESHVVRLIVDAKDHPNDIRAHQLALKKTLNGSAKREPYCAPMTPTTSHDSSRSSRTSTNRSSTRYNSSRSTGAIATATSQASFATRTIATPLEKNGEPHKTHKSQWVYDLPHAAFPIFLSTAEENFGIKWQRLPRTDGLVRYEIIAPRDTVDEFLREYNSLVQLGFITPARYIHYQRPAHVG